jgi:two-component system CheB/CheR fusion protein
MKAIENLGFPNVDPRTCSDGNLQSRKSIEARIIDRLAPPHVVVNAAGEIIHYSTRTEKYLERPRGAPNCHVLSMARKELRFELQSALAEATRKRRAVCRNNIVLETEGDRTECVSLKVEPLPDPDSNSLDYLIHFTEPHARDAVLLDTISDASEWAENENQLRDCLKATVEKYETSLGELISANEELASLNEEMQTSNEEIQSSNEELESSKEELRSLNEELQTVNHELLQKIAALDRANSDQQNMFFSTRIATVIIDLGLNIRSFTPSASELFSVISDDVGRPFSDLATQIAYSEIHADIRNVRETETTLERRVQSRDTEPLHYLARLTPYYTSAGPFDGVVISFINITNLVRAEERVQVLFANRLKMMQTMATSLAHELNQPLAAISSYLNVLRLLLPLPLEARRISVEGALDFAVGQAMRAGLIIKNLREFIASSEPDKTIFSIGGLIVQTCGLIDDEMKIGDVHLMLHLGVEEDEVIADRTRIKQILLNLMKNAREAMESTKRRELTIVTASVEDGMIRIEVKDTGAGLAEAVVGRLFEPFLTTKDGGMGIGLAMARMIVEAHYGKIWAEPNSGGGTILAFTLPSAKEALVIR